jgi:4-amino-4-deoxy-L-arabinose transferase-like glycosyltransferase
MWPLRTALVVAAVTLVRVAIASGIGLSDTEAYYASWVRTPALSYYDHPPIVAWTAWLTTRLGDTPGLVRLGPLLCGVAFDGLLYSLAARLFSPRAGFFAVALVTVVPVFFYTGFLLNPEAMLAPLWVLLLLHLYDLEGTREAWRPMVLGALIGVAFLAKYTALLAVPVVLLWLASSEQGRRWLRRPSLYAAGLLALALAAPVIVWNARRGWPSVELHLVERAEFSAPESLPAALWRVLRGQIGFYDPLILAAFFAMLAVALSRARRDPRYRFLAIASLPVLGFLLVTMVRIGDSEPHWTMVGYVPLLVGIGGWLDEAAPPARRVARLALGATFALSVAVGIGYYFFLRSPPLMTDLPGYAPERDPVNETAGWGAVRAAIRDETARLGPAAVVAGAHNVLCGHLVMALNDAPPVFCTSLRRTEFDFVGRRVPPADAPVVFVDSHRYPADTDRVLPGYTCSRARVVTVRRAGLPVGHYRLDDCFPRASGVLAGDLAPR